MNKVISNPKIGLLPLYLELYDRVTPNLRPEVEKFVATIKNEFEKKKIEVVAADICRIYDEFEKAIILFENKNVDAIVTLHLAYSPSLESAQILAKTKIPVIVLDTTPSYEFITNKDPNNIMLNHGIHGVQDLCNLLIRFDKKFVIETGHWEKSDLINKVVSDVKSAKILSSMSCSRVGSIGGPFKGMGDFFVEYDLLKKEIGIVVISAEAENLVKNNIPVDPTEVKNKLEEILSKYHTENVNKDSLIRSIKSGLLLKNWIEKNNLDAYTMNFIKIDRKSGLPTIPFLETEILLSNGIGYAGEGDVLTSAFVGALNSVYRDVTFTEMFCPDWKENIIFLSHMGEINIDLLAQKPLLLEKDLPFLDIDAPVIAVGRLKAGHSVIANLAPLKDSFILIICEGEMINIDDNSIFRESIRGWFKPETEIDSFLSRYSILGGTHHSAMVYGGKDIVGELITLGKMMGWQIAVL